MSGDDKHQVFEKIHCYGPVTFNERLAILFYMFDMEMVDFEKDKDPKRLIKAKTILEQICKGMGKVLEEHYAKQQS